MHWKMEWKGTKQLEVTAKDDKRQQHLFLQVHDMESFYLCNYTYKVKTDYCLLQIQFIPHEVMYLKSEFN